jgi:hypothetical protein
MKASIAAARRQSSGPEEVSRLGVLRERLIHGRMDGQQLREAGNLNYRVPLRSQPCKGEALAGVSAVHKDLDEGADPGGVEEGDAAHVKDEVCSRLRAKGLNEIVNGFEAQFAIELDYQAVGIRSRESLQVKLYGLHRQ